jgi:metal-responsive CopG/Arc/MetJ family transcriptional regulator
METVQVVLDKELLLATDRVARKTKVNRSALVREALRQHLLKLEVADQEARDREGYQKQPSQHHDALQWESIAAWPDEGSAAWPAE